MRKLLPFIIITWLIISLACNLPLAAITPTPFSASTTPTPLPTPSPQPSTTPIPPSPTIPEPTISIPTATPGAGWNFPGIATATPLGTPTEATRESPAIFAYYAQSGDTLPALAKRFNVETLQIGSADPIPTQGLINPGQLLVIPNTLGSPPYPSAVLPDSEVVDSPSAGDFDIEAYIQSAGGYLSTFMQDFTTETLSGAQIVEKVVENSSVNPRLLLAYIEYRSHWVNSLPASIDQLHPLGFNVPEYVGFYLELSLAARIINTGYYGWRDASNLTLWFMDGKTVRLAPQINAGTAAVQFLFSWSYKEAEWQAAIYGQDGFTQLYERMFGSPWERAALVEPLLPAGLQPPELELPFMRGELWALTGGPHPDWNAGTPWGAVDFAPVVDESPCAVSARWVTASASGVVVRSAYSTVLIELDGDGRSHAGWVLLYLHIAEKDRVAVGTHLNTNDVIGHPSCEGGEATGTNVHLARKYNGEWIGDGEALPLVLSGWTAVAGDLPYQGRLDNGDQAVIADPNAAVKSRLSR